MVRINLRRTIAVVVGIVAIVTPIAVAVQLAYQQSLANHRDRAERLAGEVLRLTETIRLQVGNAFTELEASGKSPCSDASIALMRTIAIRSDRLAGVGYLTDDHLHCSSFGRHETAIPTGPLEFRTVFDLDIRTDRELTIAPGTKLLLVTSPAGYTAAVHSRLAVTPDQDDPAVSMGVVARRSGKWLTHRGPIGQASLGGEEYLGQAAGSRVTDDHVVAWQRSRIWDYTAFAAIPSAEVARETRNLAGLLIPIGLVAGCILILVGYYTMQRNNSMRALLRAGLRRNELHVHYQPIVELATGRWVGVEALVRWRRPGGEWVSPAIFVPIAEKHGLMQQLTNRVMHLAIGEMAPFLRRHPGFFVSLNMAASDLLSRSIDTSLRDLLKRHRVQPGSIHIELTEREIVDTASVEPAIAAFRELGCHFAIDDFGVGYSNLSYLDAFQLDYLKIDRIFLAGANSSETTKQTISHIIEIAQERGIKLIAEGIETSQQLEFLKARHVELGQGWLFAKAMPVEEFERHHAKQAVRAPTGGSA